MAKRKKTPYTTNEVAYMLEQYEKGELFRAIAIECNKIFHGKRDVRTHKSVTYIVSRNSAHSKFLESLK